MSKVVKAVKKVFKAVVKVVKKVVAPVLAVAAVVYTAGAALGAFASGGALGTIAGGLKTAASSVFSFVGKAVSSAVGAVKSGFSAAKTALGFGEAAAGAAGSGALAPIEVGAQTVAQKAASSSVLGKVGAAVKSMSPLEKILATQTAFSAISAYNQPTAEELAQARASARGHQGAFYGYEKDGSGGGLFGDVGDVSDTGLPPLRPRADQIAEQSMPAPSAVSRDVTVAAPNPRAAAQVQSPRAAAQVQSPRAAARVQRHDVTVAPRRDVLGAAA